MLYTIHFEWFIHTSVSIIMIIHLWQTRRVYHKHNQTMQEHKKWLAIAHYRIGVCTRPTQIGEKHFKNSTPTVASSTHYNTGIQWWKRNEGILTSKLWGEQLTQKKKKVKDRSDGGAHWRTEVCRLFRSRLQMLCNAFIMRSTAN